MNDVPASAGGPASFGRLTLLGQVPFVLNDGSASTSGTSSGAAVGLASAWGLGPASLVLVSEPLTGGGLSTAMGVHFAASFARFFATAVALLAAMRAAWAAESTLPPPLGLLTDIGHALIDFSMH